MEKKKGTRKNRSKAYVFMMSMLMVLTSCSPVKDIGTTKIKKIVNDNLVEYYGGTFDIKKIEKKAIGVTGGGLKDQVYELEVYSDELGQTFSVRIQRDGSRMEDDFEKYKYMEEFNNEVDSISRNEQGWRASEINKFQTTLTSEERSADYEDYKKSDKMWVTVYVDVTGNDTETIAETIYEYSKELGNHGFRWIINLKRGKSVEMLKDFKHLGNITKEDIKNALEKMGVENE